MMARYTVRLGDTLWAIAERCYGNGELWSYLAEHNPLARAGVVYEGQCLEAPPPPAGARSLAEPHRHVLPLAHAPVRIRLDGSGPLFRYDGFGAFAVSGLVGELTFHRHGDVHLGELSVNRLLLYRAEQVAWARGIFLGHFGTAQVYQRDSIPPSGTNVTPVPYHYRCPDYTITGRVGAWWTSNVLNGLANAPTDVRMSLTRNLPELFDRATLVLGEAGAPPDALPEKSMPLGKALRAACPLLISPAELWGLTLDEACLLQTQPARALHGEGAGPAVPQADAPKPKKATRKKPGVEKRPVNQAKAKAPRKRAAR